MRNFNSIVLFLLLLFTHDIYAQQKKEDKNKVQFLFSFDGRRSFVLGQSARFSGLKIGAEVNDIHRFGIGFYGVRNPVFLSERLINVDFRYTALFYDYVFYSNKNWSFAAPLHIGSGQASILKTDADGKVILNPNGTAQQAEIIKFSALELSTDAQYKILRWLAVEVGVGYRNLLNNERRVREAFNGPIYSFKIKIFIGELFKPATKEK